MPSRRFGGLQFFCLATTKILCSSMNILPQVILFHKHDQDSSFIIFFSVTQKLLPVSGANMVTKTKNW